MHSSRSRFSLDEELKIAHEEKILDTEDRRREEEAQRRFEDEQEREAERLMREEYIIEQSQPAKCDEVWVPGPSDGFFEDLLEPSNS